MNRKRLPKAITRTNEDLWEINQGPGVREQRKRSARRQVSKDLRNEGVTTPQSVTRRHEVKEKKKAHETSSLPVAESLLPETLFRAEQQVLRQQSQARKIVERHTLYAAVGGLIPLPIANVAGITAIIMRMVKALSGIYEVPFERDRARSIVMGLMGGAVPTGLAAMTTSTLALVAPGSALVGLVVSSITAGALTRGIGLIFIDYFEYAAMSLSVTATEQA
jgi:uncharacterized protein (DUF697 family)